MHMGSSSLRFFRSNAKRFASVKSKEQLSQELDTSKYTLELLAVSPPYRSFKIPKKDGTWRSIEEPEEELKQVLKLLAFHLQTVYFFIKPPCAYGYILSHRSDPDKRNIVTNAHRHIQAHTLLNVDMRDFFHQCDEAELVSVLRPHFPEMEQDCLELIANLTTYHNRLPMGSPSSPVLSNYAAFRLDHAMLAWSQERNIVFTRYVDDMTFSSRTVLPVEYVKQLEEACAKFGFPLNPAKTKYYGPEDEKYVTGLMLTKEEVVLPGKYFSFLQDDLDRFAALYPVFSCLSDERSSAWVRHFEQGLTGRINHIGAVYGRSSATFRHYQKKLQAAKRPVAEEIYMNWLDLPYEI